MGKKLLTILVLAVLLLCACGETPPAEDSAETTAATQATLPGEITSSVHVPGTGTTLMVYMIGSDLEAKAAAGTTDLTEMAESGVDLSNANVLVYAGGSPYWHNDVVPEQSNTILSLTGDGFTAVHSEPAASMGEPETLTNFLTYCYQNYPAERYGLILWNHGSGPVRGYGQDLVFEGGSLLLSEMDQAMAASPFGADNKLFFVGFDACLMASAELACIWDDYADYMVSSQEVEPSIGWNYQFLKDITAQDTPAMLTELTQSYLRNCEAYYAEKKYDHRETTLSCSDLSKAPELESAINALFQKASGDIEKNYDRLSALRVQTRSFGRASTGSEYDLVDLGDAAKQLQDLYPEEANQLLQVLEQMVIANSTNTEMCSGLSLYYPFYNKDYFYKSIQGADSWQTTYQNLGLFPGYQTYLDAYQAIWNGTDRLDKFASSIMPSIQNGSYTLQLTEEQQSCYASCRYYILARESVDLYKLIFASSDVTNRNGLLTANFDGNAIYVKSKYSRDFLPAVEEKDRIGDLSHYSVHVGFSRGMEAQFITGELYNLESYRYHLVLDKDAGTLDVSALLPSSENPNDLLGGKLEEGTIYNWRTILFMDQPHLYLTRDESGRILPLSQWSQNDWITGMELSTADDITFVYEPLAGGEYFLIMEVRDTQGNRYCSEVLPITVPEKEEKQIILPEKEFSWESGDRLLLAEENNVTVYINRAWEKGKMRFTLEVVNNNDFAVQLKAKDLVCNDTVYCTDYWDSVYAWPGQTAWFSYPESLGLAETCGALENLRTISFSIHVRDDITGATLIEPHFCNISLSQTLTEDFRADYERAQTDDTPFMEARADKQVVYSDDRLRVTLLSLGTGYSYSIPRLYGVLYAENLTDETITMDLSGIVINNIFIPIYSDISYIPAGLGTHIKLELSDSKFEELGITQIHSLSLLLRTVRDHYVFTGYSTPVWCDVVLSHKADSLPAFKEGTHVLYDKNGIRIAAEPAFDDYSGTSWNLTICNQTDTSIKVSIIDQKATGNFESSPSTYIQDGQAGPGQYARTQLTCYTSIENLEELSFRFQILDIFEQQILFTDDTVITLRTK